MRQAIHPSVNKPSRLRATVRGTLIVMALGVAAIYFAPPALLRVGANYAAKIVCSNVFIAQRDLNSIIDDDLAAPGHPLFKTVRIVVDRELGLVQAHMLGFAGQGLAIYRPGTGCATVSDGDVALARQHTFTPAPIAPPASAVDWPQGARAQTNPAVQALIAKSELNGPGARGVAVIHKGKLIAQHYAPGFDQNTPLLGWSMTKTVTAALIGTQIGAGKLKLEQDGFWPVTSPADGREKITLADLLAMSSGLRFNEGYGDVSDVTRMLYLEPDMAGFVHALPLEHSPAKVWSYSSGTTVLLSHILQNAVGKDALPYARNQLFLPLGMSSAIIEADARGTLVGSSYMYASAPDWARFAQFLLQDGVWNGKRLLPAGYVDYMREAAPASMAAYGKPQYGKGQLWLRGAEGGTPEGQNPDAAYTLPDDTFWMSGHDGESIAIVPSKQLVVVRLGLTPKRLAYQPQGMLQAVIKVLE